jgi:hypothetical protein
MTLELMTRRDPFVRQAIRGDISWDPAEDIE